jgi:hypothetical protein
MLGRVVLAVGLLGIVTVARADEPVDSGFWTEPL